MEECGYCDAKKHNPVDFDNYSESSNNFEGCYNYGNIILMFSDDDEYELKKGDYVLDISEGRTKINYCPMCGRKL
ncbi:hypothetical protein [Lactobacillus terrae]|uniref:hypothetical protein n=1 Tax=Lactobacillus terrae TaxID=2269374 RepID=UPI000C1B65E0|nr:hypothetical protein [Lactobacillus terrae]